MVSKQLNEQVISVFNDLSDEKIYSVEGMTFQGTYGVACVDADGLQYLYLGHGKQLATSEFEIASVEGSVAACLYRKEKRFWVSCSGPVRVRTPEGVFTVSAGYRQIVGGE